MTKVCPQCGGDGYLVVIGEPGYYSESFGNYLPSERLEQCERCGGLGWVEEEEAA